jgi:hypothetical protein
MLLNPAWQGNCHDVRKPFSPNRQDLKPAKLERKWRPVGGAACCLEGNCLIHDRSLNACVIQDEKCIAEPGISIQREYSQVPLKCEYSIPRFTFPLGPRGNGQPNAR